MLDSRSTVPCQEVFALLSCSAVTRELCHVLLLLLVVLFVLFVLSSAVLTV